MEQVELNIVIGIIFSIIAVGLTTAGLAVSLIVTIVGASWMLNAKLDRIWKAIGEVRENFVKDTECEKHRKDCPCVKDMQYLRENGLINTSAGGKHASN